MKVLLDTHFLLWVIMDSPRLDEFADWFGGYEPWGVSPVSLLELAFLGETGRIGVRREAFVDAIASDPRVVVDDLPLLTLVRQAIAVDWTRDPFDRLLAAHSHARRVPLCTVDRVIRREHPLVVRELRA